MAVQSTVGWASRVGAKMGVGGLDGLLAMMMRKAQNLGVHARAGGSGGSNHK